MEKEEASGRGEERREDRVAEEVGGRYSNDPLFPGKSLDDVIDNYEMIREA